MFTYRKFKILLGLLLLSAPLFCTADVLINVTASMITPACNISTEDGNKKLDVGFGTLNIEQINSDSASTNFALYITDCDFAKNLSIVMTPKTTSTLDFNGRKILATDLDGIGIDFIDTTVGTVPHLLEVVKKEKITPERINNTKYRINLLALLRSVNPNGSVPAGKFNAAMTIFATYD